MCLASCKITEMLLISTRHSKIHVTRILIQVDIFIQVLNSDVIQKVLKKITKFTSPIRTLLEVTVLRRYVMS